MITIGDYMKIKHAVAERFMELCTKNQIKPNELANLSGVTPSTVYSMLDPKREDIYISTIKKLCDGLNISVCDFFNSSNFELLEQEIE